MGVDVVSCIDSDVIVLVIYRNMMSWPCQQEQLSGLKIN